MRDFSRLFAELDARTATTGKVEALVRHLQAAADADAAWVVYLLSGGKPRQAVPTAVLRETAQQAAGVPPWLFEECYQAVGDLAETLALVLPHGPLAGASPCPLHATDGLARWMEEGLLPLRDRPAPEQAQALLGQWSVLEPDERLLLTKLVGGGFRVGVSKLLVQRALARLAGLEPTVLAQRMMGHTQAQRRPTAEAYRALLRPLGEGGDDAGQPYPFFLAHPLEQPPEALGPVSDWLVEWKFDGIRAQLVRRAAPGEADNAGVWLWSRGEELITERFPEVVRAAQALPVGTVLDGELLVMRDGQPAPFAELQTRLNRKTLPKALLARSPVGFMAYDLLEWQGADWRGQAQHRRREALEGLMAAVAPQDGAVARVLSLSPAVQASDWAALDALRQRSRERGVEGFMLKHRQASYGVGRRKGGAHEGAAWWKWKVAPMTVDAVLVYAQRGHGRRAGVYTDYSFAVWNRTPESDEEVQAVLQAIAQRQAPQPDGLQLVTLTKAYSGLSDAEFAQVDQVIKRSTVDKFGPVRSVVPSLVMELGFEAMAPSPRHRSGLALRFPRMLRIRSDKPLREADTLDALQARVARAALGTD